MNTLEILKAGRELISDESRWIRGQVARSANGSAVHANNERAVCWCSIGALYKAAGSHSIRVIGDPLEVLDEAAEELGDDTAISYNDTHTHAEVLAMWDRAIAAESAKVAP